jgi:hypothetical protein
MQVRHPPTSTGRFIIGRSGRAFLTFALAGSFAVAVGGCRGSGRVVERGGQAVERGGEKARTLLGTVDPTGVVAETAARQRAWEELRAKIEAVDVDV